MNRYDIICASDAFHKIFDIYIDTIDAWTAEEAIKEFQKRNFALSKNVTIHGGVLMTREHLFKAFPTRLDTEHPFRYIYLMEDVTENVNLNTNPYLRKEKN